MTTPQLHIALLAFPFASHPNSLLEFVQTLSPFLPSGTILSFFNTSQSNTSLFSKGLKQDNITFYDVWDGVTEENGNTLILPEAVNLFIQATPDNYEKAMKEAEEETGVKISCILSDAFLWFSYKLAEKISVPWIAFRTGAPGSILLHLYTDSITSNEEAVSTTPGFSSTLKMSDIVMTGTLDQPMTSLLHNMALSMHKAAAVVLNSFEELDPLINKEFKVKFQKVLNIGPLFLQPTFPKKVLDVSDESGCILWLEKQKEKSVVYLCFGTIATAQSNEIVAVAEALEAKKVPFIWSLKDDLIKNLPKGFLERTEDFGKIVSWAPQLEILKHSAVAVFVTHCGWNSTLEGISCGVPMLCRPFFGDQKLNSSMVESVWQIGLQIEGGSFTKSGTISALDTFFSEENGTVLRENAKGLKERALEAMKPDGSSSKNFKELVELLKCDKLT